MRPCVFNRFSVNAGVLSVVCGREDYIICDDRDHASIVDGRRLSFATCLKYKHNDMDDLEKQLQKCRPDSIKLIVVDGVFSMEGDLANLPEIIRLKKNTMLPSWLMRLMVSAYSERWKRCVRPLRCN